MIRKKQSSLTKTINKNKSLTKNAQRQQPQENNKQKLTRMPSTCLKLMKVNQFIQQYQILKQNYSFNLSSRHIFEEEVKQFQCQQQSNDKQFKFYIDFGVPFVQSHHLDSGFQFQDYQFQEKLTKKQFQKQTKFPIVSSGKQIFTSILEISDIQQQEKENQVDDEGQNFTDQQQDQKDFKIMNKQTNVKLTDQINKQKYPAMNKIKEIRSIQVTKQNKTQNFLYAKRNTPLSFLIQQNFQKGSSNTQILLKLKQTAQARKQKLKYWNSRLFQMQNQSIKSGNFSQLSAQRHNNLLKHQKNKQTTVQIKNQNRGRKFQIPQIKKTTQTTRINIKPYSKSKQKNFFHQNSYPGIEYKQIQQHRQTKPVSAKQKIKNYERQQKQNISSHNYNKCNNQLHCGLAKINQKQIPSVQMAYKVTKTIINKKYIKRIF